VSAVGKRPQPRRPYGCRSGFHVPAGPWLTETQWGVRGTQEYTRVLKSLLYSLLNHHLIISLGRVLRGLEVGRGVALAR
jgi:hypothetical protein